MARKKDKRGGRLEKHGPGADAFADMPPIPDRRAMERILRQVAAEIDPEASRPASALDKAQEVIYDAFEAEGKEQVRLARKALAISPDCADAYVLLAEQSERPEEALPLYEQGVAAGERALGHEAFQKHEGHFWGVLETRPYMRARLGLAQCLWEMGRREEAVGHYREMLRLNPNDNQGVRYLLAACLLDLNRTDELGQLLEEYREDSSADWAYTRALVAYSKEGDSPRARKLLCRAAKSNKYVPAYLLGNKPLPNLLPEYITSGGEDEAISYAGEYLSGWRGTPGALGWLRKTLKQPIRPEGRKRRASWPELRLALRRLPQEKHEHWQIDYRSLPVAASEPDSNVPGWLLLVADTANGVLVDVGLAADEPTAAELWDFLLATMQRPKQGEPRRPGSVQASPEWAAKWRSKLKQIQVACSASLTGCDEMDRFVELARSSMGHLARQFAGTAPAGGDPAELPQQVGEVWQADIRKFPGWIGNQGEPMRPWVLLVTNRSDDFVMAHDLRTDLPDVEWFWRILCRAMAEPAAGQPHRPGVIEFASAEYAEALRPRLEAASIRVAICDRLDHLDFVLKDMSEHLGGSKPLAALVEVPGMALEQVGGFFAAAAEFYRRAPWRDVPGDTPIRIQCDKFQSGPWYAVVMGQRGMTLGLAIYEDLDALRALLSGDESEEEYSRRMSGLSIMYGEAFEIAVADLDAAEKYGWPVAAPEAYPEAIRVNPGRSVRPVLPWELELLEGCLRAIPEFLAAQSASQTRTVSTAKGPLTLQLSWLEESGP